MNHPELRKSVESLECISIAFNSNLSNLYTGGITIGDLTYLLGLSNSIRKDVELIVYIYKKIAKNQNKEISNYWKTMHDPKFPEYEERMHLRLYFESLFFLTRRFLDKIVLLLKLMYGLRGNILPNSMNKLLFSNKWMIYRQIDAEFMDKFKQNMAWSEKLIETRDNIAHSLFTIEPAYTDNTPTIYEEGILFPASSEIELVRYVDNFSNSLDFLMRHLIEKKNVY